MVEFLIIIILILIFLILNKFFQLLNHKYFETKQELNKVKKQNEFISKVLYKTYDVDKKPL